MAALVEADRLRKTFGPITAVDEISLAVEKGEVLGFLGPNGAGKSTTMKMLTGFLEPDSGTARIGGIDVGADPKKAKALIGYLPEGAPLYGDMTPAGFLAFCAEVRGLDGPERAARVAAAVAKTGLESVVEQPISTLSKGFKRRVGLAQAILHNPPVLILDEPTDGLDPNQKHHVRQLIAEMAKEKAIIISTHILEEVEAVCTRAIIIDRGRIVADGTAEELQQRLPEHNSVVVTLPVAALGAAESALEGAGGITSVTRLPAASGRGRLRVKAADAATAPAKVAGLLRDKSVTPDEIYVERARLDDVFREITSSEHGVRHA